ncbi:MAG: SCO family protein [Bdellovibrionales bacterium]
MLKNIQLVLILCLTFSVSTLSANSFLKPEETSNKKPEVLTDVGVTEHLGQNIDLNLEFKDHNGETVQLGKYFKGKPVMLALIYYNCPSLCNFQLNGVTDTMKEMKWSAGKEYEAVFISFEPKETPELAKKKRDSYLELYGREGAKDSFHFLTGSQENITKIASQVGFGYKWVEEQKEYAHAAATYILSPGGKITRYLYGIAFTAATLRLSLVEAAEGKVGSIADQLLLYCFKYDPSRRGYAFYAFNIMRAGAGVTVIILAAFLIPFWIRQRKVKQKENA